MTELEGYEAPEEKNSVSSLQKAYYQMMLSTLF